VHRPQLGLQFGDPPLGHRELGLLGTAQARFQVAVDTVLAAPGVDRLITDAQRLGDLGDWPASLDQVQHLAAELRRVAASSHAALLSVGQHGIQQRDSTEVGEDQTHRQNQGRLPDREDFLCRDQPSACAFSGAEDLTRRT
jgi:hypothetical protein